MVGDGSGKYRVRDVEAHDECDEHYYRQWPAAHQDAAADALPGEDEAGWQIKSIWHFLGDDSTYVGRLPP